MAIFKKTLRDELAMHFRFPLYMPVEGDEAWEVIATQIESWREQPPAREPGLLQTKSILPLYHAWKSMLATSAGSPASLTLQGIAGVDRAPVLAGVHLAIWPSFRTPGLIVRFDVGQKPPIRFVGLRVIFFPDDGGTYEQNLRVPASEPSAWWEYSLGVGLAALSAGVEPKAIDDAYFNGNDAWRKFYAARGGRVVRARAGGFASVEDVFDE